MAARQQMPFRSATTKFKATDSKAAKEADVRMQKRTTGNDWVRLGELIKPEVTIFLVTVEYKNFDQHAVGKENDHRNNGKLKKVSKKVQKIIFLAGNEDFTSGDAVRDFGLIKCLSWIYDITNPYFWIPALDGFDVPLQRPWDFNSGGPVKTASQRTKERKARAFKVLATRLDPRARVTFSDAVEHFVAAAKQLLVAREESDSRKKADVTKKFNSKEKPKTTERSDVKLESKAAQVPDSRKNAKATDESDSETKVNATDYSDARIELKATKRPKPRMKAKSAKQCDFIKRTKTRKKSSAKQGLNAIERETRSGKEEMTHDSEAGKGTDSNQEEKASNRPDSKSIRTCMTCGLQEPAPKVFKKCRRCKDEGYSDPPYYCGRDCQVLDWTARHRQQHEKNYAADSTTS